MKDHYTNFDNTDDISDLSLISIFENVRSRYLQTIEIILILER